MVSAVANEQNFADATAESVATIEHSTLLAAITAAIAMIIGAATSSPDRPQLFASHHRHDPQAMTQLKNIDKFRGAGARQHR